MIKLIEISIKEFKKEIYPEYLKLFPPLERKSYHTIKKTVKKGYTNILKIVYENTTIGFFILNIINNYIQIDYFAIFKEYQSKGYGSMALSVLKNKYIDSNGIFIEIEKPGLGLNDSENTLRKRRYNFYKQADFENLDFDLLLYDVTYTPCCYNYNKKQDKNFLIKTLFDFYYLPYSKKMVDKNCKVIE